MFKAVVHDGSLLGFAGTRANRFFFFGSRHVTRLDMEARFPHYSFHYLKQVHGRSVIQAQSGTPEADGHFTDQPGHALVIQSADCVPVLLAGNRRVGALHAGWRGVAQNIVDASRAHLQAEFAAIGPHIAFASFEVGADVKDRLTQACPGEGSRLFRAGAHGKYFFDLKSGVRAQLHGAFSMGLEIVEQTNDTLTDQTFNSFRRDRQAAGRNLSFVVINP